MVCWFCGLIEENPKKSLKLDMYGEVDSKTSDTLTKVAYNVRKIIIPRCSSCHSRHSLAKRGVFGLILMLFLTLVLALISLFGVITGFWAGALTGLLLGLALAGLAVKVSVLKGIKTIRDAKTKHPSVKELLLKSYKFGKKPKDHEKESKEEREDKKEEDKKEEDKEQEEVNK